MRLDRDSTLPSAETERVQLFVVCGVFLLLSLWFGTEKLDGDEFHVIKEPYEMLGGDYTKGYLAEGEYGAALATAWKAYRLYWRYRPLFAPVIADEHKSWFQAEERKFGYVKPESVPRGDPDSLSKYQARLVVPEPDRFYQHGAGKPLLPTILSIPQLALVALVSSGEELLVIQHEHRQHPLFILTRLVQILSGLATILIVAHIARTEFGAGAGPTAAAIAAFIPITPMYFADIHADSTMAPFLILSTYLLYKEKVIAGGAVYGLALASKNTAIFLLPAFALFYFIECVRVHGGSLSALSSSLLSRAGRLLVFVLIGMIVMSPFAHPGSYVLEILTPVIDRPFDTRGEDVARWIIGRQQVTDAPGVDSRLAAALSLGTAFQFLLLIALFLAVQIRLRPMGTLSFLMLLMIIPYGLVFAYAFNWRFLMFVPFAALFSVDSLGRPYAVGLAAAFLAFTLIQAFVLGMAQ